MAERQRQPLKLSLAKAAEAAIRQHGRTGYPHEVCGVLLGRGGATPEVLEAVACGNANTERSADRYLIDPQDQLRVEKDARARGLDVVGYYHSHPDHPSQASETDRAQSWEGLAYLILAVEKGRDARLQGWWRTAGSERFEELSLESV